MNHLTVALDTPLARFLFVVCMFLGIEHCTGAQDISDLWAKPLQVGSVSVSLPPPSFDDAMNDGQQEAVLKEVAGKYPLERFLKDSIVTPFSLSRESIKDEAGERIGHRVDVWFVAYGSLEAIRDQDLFASLVNTEGTGEQNSGEVLSAEVLKPRGLTATSEEGCERNWCRFSVEVLDRVLLQGVVATITKSTDTSHFAGVRLDERFRDDEAFPNRWRHVDAGANGLFPYSGLAAYAKATRLAGHDNAILVECHAVIHEPADWFQGANLLSSKLPLVTQDAIRSFRRKLSK